MIISRLIDTLPLLLIYAGTIAIVLFSIVAGIWFGRFWRKRFGEEREEAVDTVVAAVLALLAFLLAFTVGLTAARFDSRKQLLLDEVNAIGTTFLRTDFLPEPHRAEVRRLLKNYVDIRVDMIRNPATAMQGIKRSEELQERMWAFAQALSLADIKNPDIAALFVESLNEMIDLQTSRVVVALMYRLPAPMWSALLGITILSMISVGYLFGKSEKVNWALILLLALAFSLVVALIADLDRSGGGKLGVTRINQQAMLDLQERLEARMSKE
ncbi:MAG: DUF4239 domain-containing protein [Candidatus Abyssobacteria bacterium SURF_5]|uniref:DUF4239 domain-containing protein n=1 Tax=Abyssobacteria bacterium (strain SURF_5) TaxID=2093360 RepID=A0A3A4NCI8_ABYX5|nr:MAG: DUF4239 domain-containing protein [Candidatus Abyssubacteria bacterium SURF_5]